MITDVLAGKRLCEDKDIDVRIDTMARSLPDGLNCARAKSKDQDHREIGQGLHIETWGPRDVGLELNHHQSGVILVVSDLLS